MRPKSVLAIASLAAAACVTAAPAPKAPAYVPDGNTI